MKIDVNNAMIAEDTGTYTLSEAVRILACRSRIGKRIRRKNMRCYITAVALIVIGILSIFAFKNEDVTAGVFLIIIGITLAVTRMKGGIR